MTAPHIGICVCTYKRPLLLDSLLARLEQQSTRGAFSFSIVLIDNDRSESARAIAERWARGASVAIRYHVEPEQNIARARNAAVVRAPGEFVAFIDDDEEPAEDWLVTLYTTLVQYDADGVLGPVTPRFEATAPPWAISSGLFDRPGYATGHKIHWRVTGTGNALVRRSVFDGLHAPFDDRLASGGEDVDFFRRAMAAGNVFVWCNEAAVSEVIPAERTRVSFQIRRALLRGKVARLGPGGDLAGVMKSAAACIVYTVMLPAFLMMGWPVFLKYLIKDFDHLGKVMAACRIDLVGDKYIVK